MQYYVSKNNNKLNRREFTPELINNRVCLNPLYKVQLKRKVNVLLDSGAFQDTKYQSRVSFARALGRQLEFETHSKFEAESIVSYDRMVDEAASPEGRGKNKRRVSYYTGERYVAETIDAAKYLADQRRDLRPRRLILSAQGVTSPQYLRCVKEILRFAEPTDILGLGGFCIIGQVPRLKKQYYKVLEAALPMVKRKGLKRVHVFGVGHFGVLVRTHMLCRSYGIIPSYDTSSYEFNSVLGRVFQPDVLHRGFDGPRMSPSLEKKDKYSVYHPRDWAHFNIELVSHFWERLNRQYPIRGERHN